MASLEKVKSGKNYIVYTSDGQKLIKIENVRFSYPYFGKQREDDQDDGEKKLSWGGVAMLPKSTHVEAKEAFVEIMNEILAAQPNDKGGKGIKIEPQYKCIKNGDDKDDETMHGHWLISFSEAGKRRPAARDVNGGLIVEEAEIDAKFYGGCWGSVLLRPWFFNGKSKKSTKTFPKRICSGFTGVQFLKDDTPFGNARIDDTEAWGSAEGASSGGNDAMDDDGL